jgi:hypothetical protein
VLRSSDEGVLGNKTGQRDLHNLQPRFSKAFDSLVESNLPE